MGLLINPYAFAAPAPTSTLVGTAASAWSTGATSRSATIPALLAGDVIYAFGASGSGSTGLPPNGTLTDPSYTAEATQTKASSTRATASCVFSKVADGSEGGTSLTMSWATSTQCGLYIAVIRPLAARQDFDSNVNASPTLTHAAPTGTATGAALGLVFFSSAVGGQFDATLVLSGATSQRVSGSNNHAAALGSFSMAAAGSSPAITGTRNANNSNVAWTAYTILL